MRTNAHKRNARDRGWGGTGAVVTGPKSTRKTMLADLSHLLLGHPGPWTIRAMATGSYVLDANGVDVMCFDDEQLSFWRGIVAAVNIAAAK